MTFLQGKRKFSRAHASVFILTFCSMDTLLFGTNGNGVWKFLLVGALLTYEIAILIYAFYNERRRVRFCYSSVLTSAIYVIFLALTQVSAAFSGSYAMEIQYFFHIILFIIIMSTVHLVSSEQFIEAFIDIMCIYGIAAICLFLLEKGGVAYNLPSYKVRNTSGYLYYHFGLGVVAAPREYVPVRAYGIFREPGVFATYLSVAICFELFFGKRPRYIRILLMGVSALLTYSTAGYIAMGMYLCLYVLLKPSQTNMECAGKALIIVCSFLMIFFGFSDKLQEEVFGKLFVANASLNSRVYSIIGGFTYSLQSPLFGLGWAQVTNEFDQYMSLTYNLSNISFTNTYMRMACTYGWLFTSLSIYGVWRFYARLTKLKRMALLLTFCWIVVFSNESFLINPLIYIVIYYGCEHCSSELENRRYENTKY